MPLNEIVDCNAGRGATVNALGFLVLVALCIIQARVPLPSASGCDSVYVQAVGWSVDMVRLFLRVPACTSRLAILCATHTPH